MEIDTIDTRCTGIKVYKAGGFVRSSLQRNTGKFGVVWQPFVSQVENLT